MGLSETPIRTLSIWLFGVLFGVFAIVTALVAIGLFTEGGGRWLTARLPGATNGQFESGQFSGRLWDDFELRDIRLEHPAARGTIGRLRIAWSARALFDREVVIEAIEADRIDLEVTPQPSADDAPPPEAVPAPPLPITLRRIALSELAVVVDGTPVAIDRLLLGAAWDAESLRLSGFEIEAYGHRLGATGSIEVGEEPTVRADAEWAGDVAGESGVGSLQLSGPLADLRFETSIDANVSAQVQGTIHPLADELNLAVSGTVEPPALGEGVTLAATRFDLEGSLSSLAVSIETEAGIPQTGVFAVSFDTDVALGSAGGDGITATLNWRAEPRRPGMSPVTGSGKVRYADDRIRIDHTTAAPYRTRFAGDVMLAGAAPMLELAIDWSDIRYAAGETGGILAREGAVTLIGPPSDLAIVLNSNTDVPTLGPTSLNARGRLGESSLTIETLDGHLLHGTIEGSGAVDWKDAVGGKFSVAARTIDLAVIRPDTPSRLDLDLHGDFSLGDTGTKATLELDALDGYLRGQAVTGSARARIDGDRYVLERSRLVAGRNAIRARGTWSQNLDGEFDLDLADLALFSSGYAGSIKGSGTIGGPATQPAVKLSLTGRDLDFYGFSAAALDADIDVDMARQDLSNAIVTLGTVAFEGKTYGDFSTQVHGNTSVHTIEAALDGSLVAFEAHAAGGLVDNVWRGKLNALDVRSEETGAWSLEAPGSVTIGATNMALGETCLTAAPARVCIAGTKDAAAAQAALRLSALPLGLANYSLPATLKLAGRADGSAELKLADGTLTGRGTATVTDGAVERETGAAGTERIAIEAFALDFDLRPDTIAANVDTTIERWFSLRGRINAGRAAGTPIDGTIDARSDDVSWLAEFVPELGGTNGGFMLSANVTGNAEAPVVNGRLRLVDGAVRVPDTGLVIDRIESTFNGSPSSLRFDTLLAAGTGTLDLGGTMLKDESGNWRYDVGIGGKDFPLVRIPEAEADISPDLKLTGTNEGLHVSGTLFVPRVMIDVKRLPASAVSVSDDEVIIAADGSTPEQEQRSSFVTDKLSGDVKIRLGDDISINGFGLTSRLSGGVDWSKKRGSPLGAANGVIAIDEGVFKAYGQHMEIENGRIRFAGPVDNPSLYLRAYRPDLPVKAGVDVSGTVRAPKISLFSEPPQTDGNTLSYIVTGRALDDASAGDANLLTQAALSLGAEESAVVTSQIRNTFGLDEFSVSAGDTVQDTSLVAGKRLSPKLSVRTDYNPFDQLWTFFLNYKLTQRWSVEAESGERQGADLLYSIERESLLDSLNIFE